MKSYYRVLLGPKSRYAEECFTNGFIGIDFGIDQNFTNKIPEDSKLVVPNGPFTYKIEPIYQSPKTCFVREVPSWPNPSQMF